MPTRSTAFEEAQRYFDPAYRAQPALSRSHLCGRRLADRQSYD